MNKIKVMKFGGTSVRTPEARLVAAERVISAKEAGFQPVVVVSAIGRKGEPYATDTLINLLRSVDPQVEPEPREMDMMMACGEILSSAVFAQTLKSLGQPAMAMRGGQAGIRTDGVYGNARIVAVQPIGLFEALKQGAIPVVCGFQGVWNQGGLPGAELTTLGRGGSDTTAAALGAAIGAVAVEIFTDVDGVKTADPDFVPGAPTLRRVTYDEVAEIAHLGAKVLHPRAAEIAMKFSTSLWVKSTFSDDPGTEILPKQQLTGRRVTGVTHSGKLVYIQVDLGEMDQSHRREFEAKVYETLASHEINLFMINMSSASIGFAVPRQQFPQVQDLFDSLVVPLTGDAAAIYLVQSGAVPTEAVSTQEKLLSPLGAIKKVRLAVTEACTMVSLVGRDYLQQPGIFFRLLDGLNRAGIPVLQTSDSDYSLSVLIPESEIRRAVLLVHTEFGLSEAS